MKFFRYKKQVKQKKKSDLLHTMESLPCYRRKIRHLNKNSL